MSDKRRDWLTIIPVLFWILCMVLSAGKMVQTDNEYHIIDWMEMFNSNTFATYVSMVISMSYQFFSVTGKKQQEKSGLSRKWIHITILSTIIYAIVAIVNACRYCMLTTLVMTVSSIVYIILFFKYMKLKQ